MDDLDSRQIQFLIEDHMPSSSEKYGFDHDHLSILTSSKEIIIQEPYQSSNALVSLKCNELHSIQKLFQEDLQGDGDDNIDDGSNLNVIEIVSDVIVVMNSYEDQDVNIQLLLPKHHEIEISESQGSFFFMSNLFMMSIWRMKKSRFLSQHAWKLTTISPQYLMNMMKVFLKMMINKKLLFSWKLINSIMRTMNLYMMIME
jgi:hypothetical protein